MFPSIVLNPPWTKKYFLKLQAIEVLGSNNQSGRRLVQRPESVNGAVTVQLQPALVNNAVNWRMRRASERAANQPSVDSRGVCVARAPTGREVVWGFAV